ncbi:MAG: 2-succinyl-5-enolpyruvyl-6-hydroxy-3-cyclohexene-1-carboxylate synthase, partial [Deltaproteobacteria bacterium]|nr:2-succinyl-5-enolpyruvyl-6-hydroxy-3-cyclohexene-1-carboxylate synthase [Deltaproteobacteria bacterium]
MTNIARAEQVLEVLAACGVADICLCPGGRNSPFVTVLGKSQGFRLFTFPEERTAAFFALGRARATKRPVAVMTTSGTAVAELLPATIEAFYSGVPLVLVTADRPKSYRGTGAPQAIEQSDLFGVYV